MPYLIDEDEDEQYGGQVATGGGGAPAVPPSKSGAFTPLSKYLEANAARIPEFGAKVAGKVEAGGQSALQKQQEASSAFGQKVLGGTPTFNEGLLSEAVSKPQDILKDQGKLEAFQGQRFAEYGGPQSYEGSNEAIQAKTAAEQAKAFGKSFEDESGRIEAVKSFQDPSRITQGKAVLDAALLGMTPQGGLSAIQSQIAPVTQNLTNYLDQSGKNIAEQQKAAIEAGGTAAQDIRGRVNEAFFGNQGVIPTLGQTLEQRAPESMRAAELRDRAVRDRLAFLANMYSDTGGLASVGTASSIGGTGTPAWAVDAGFSPESYRQFIDALASYQASGQEGGQIYIYKDVDRYGNPTGEYFISESPGKHAPLIGATTTGIDAPRLDLPAYLSQAQDFEMQNLFTPEAVATEGERAKLAALEQLLDTDIGYYSGAALPAPVETSDYDIQGALDLITGQTRTNLDRAAAIRALFDQHVTAEELADLGIRV